MRFRTTRGRSAARVVRIRRDASGARVVVQIRALPGGFLANFGATPPSDLEPALSTPNHRRSLPGAALPPDAPPGLDLLGDLGVVLPEDDDGALEERLGLDEVGDVLLVRDVLRVALLRLRHLALVVLLQQVLLLLDVGLRPRRACDRNRAEVPETRLNTRFSLDCNRSGPTATLIAALAVSAASPT